MNKKILIIAAVSCALAVILGAFGAHALKQLLSEKGLATFETAVRYQFYHSFALLAAGILSKDFFNRSLRWAARLFVLGIIFFCGSLYLLTIMEIQAINSFKWVGAITPVGGICFITGWILMAVAIAKTK